MALNYCPKCGERLDKDAMKCTKCNYDLSLRKKIQLTLIEEKKKEISKGKIKKLITGLTKQAGKVAVEAVGDKLSEVAGDVVSDKLTELTKNELLSDITGKITEKGLQKFADYSMEKVGEKISGLSKNETATNVINDLQKIKIDYENRLLGAIKIKRQVKIEYLKSILNLPKEEIIGIIYELVGKEIISGEFNEDDSEFLLFS